MVNPLASRSLCSNDDAFWTQFVKPRLQRSPTSRLPTNEYSTACSFRVLGRIDGLVTKGTLAPAAVALSDLVVLDPGNGVLPEDPCCPACGDELHPDGWGGTLRRVLGLDENLALIARRRAARARGRAPKPCPVKFEPSAPRARARALPPTGHVLMSRLRAAPLRRYRCRACEEVRAKAEPGSEVSFKRLRRVRVPPRLATPPPAACPGF